MAMKTLIESKLIELFGANWGVDRAKTYASELHTMGCFVVQGGELRLKPSYRGSVPDEVAQNVPAPTLSNRATAWIAAHQELRDLGFR
jgi:hypothetical protein